MVALSLLLFVSFFLLNASHSSFNYSLPSVSSTPSYLLGSLLAHLAAREPFCQVNLAHTTALKYQELRAEVSQPQFQVLSFSHSV